MDNLFTSYDHLAGLRTLGFRATGSQRSALEEMFIGGNEREL
jgi:hypothetical protein